MRITKPLLAVLDAFLRAWEDDQDLYGWTIMKEIGRSGPTVYGILDRLEDAEWITGNWEQDTAEGRPRRRFYRLTLSGHTEAQRIVTARRPAPSPRVARRPLPGLSSLRTAVWPAALHMGGAR
jgi:DNA-binding PadR family transcriptional regulator